MTGKVIVSSMMSAALALVCCSCEWSAGGGADSWSDSYSWANFSGTYRGAGNGVLVTDYSTSGGQTGTGQKNFGSTSTSMDYAGSFGVNSIVGKTVVINFGGTSFVDDGSGNLSGSGGSGNISYSTGNWAVQFTTAPVADQAITGWCDYNGGSSGASGKTIYSFVVWQTGNELQITDNNGCVYKGSMGEMGGTMTGTNSLPSAGDTAIAQYSAEGTSAAGFKVTIAGNFQGSVSANGTYLENRKMYGTWIEDGGLTGDVNGESSPILVTN